LADPLSWNSTVRAEVNRAISQGIVIHAVGVGTTQCAHRERLDRIAGDTGGRFFLAPAQPDDGINGHPDNGAPRVGEQLQWLAATFGIELVD
jgi:hypothetical protein